MRRVRKKGHDIYVHAVLCAVREAAWSVWGVRVSRVRRYGQGHGAEGTRQLFTWWLTACLSFSWKLTTWVAVRRAGRAKLRGVWGGGERTGEEDMASGKVRWPPALKMRHMACPFADRTPMRPDPHLATDLQTCGVAREGHKWEHRQFLGRLPDSPQLRQTPAAQASPSASRPPAPSSWSWSSPLEKEVQARANGLKTRVHESVAVVGSSETRCRWCAFNGDRIAA
jgi:hypothetical protein